MDRDKSEQLDILKNLVHYCIDSAEGYETMANQVEEEEPQNENYSTIFRRLSQQRKGFAETLNKEINSLGGSIVQTGTFEGNLHHSWLKIKSMIATDTISDLIETAKDGEQFIFDYYQKVITNENIPSYIRSKLIEQQDLVKGAHLQLGGFQTELK